MRTESRVQNRRDGVQNRREATILDERVWELERTERGPPLLVLAADLRLTGSVFKS